MSEPTPGPSISGLVREHPRLFIALVVCILLGTGLSAVFMTDDWSLGRRITAGALAGFGSWFVVAANRLLGAWREP